MSKRNRAASSMAIRRCVFAVRKIDRTFARVFESRERGNARLTRYTNVRARTIGRSYKA